MAYLRPTAGQAREAAGSTETAALLTAIPVAAEADLNQDITETYVEAEVQAISDKVDALLAKLRTAGILAS